jgi:thiol-disulfide isomerase/thioredoxin
MRKGKVLIMLLFALLPFIGWAQQKNYDAQHVSIKRSTGDSIQYDISSGGCFKPIVRNGKVEWSFQRYTNDGTEEVFALKDVESVDFRSIEYDEKEVRKALIDFYHAMDGDNWPEEKKTNWCSDKPIWEWYGVNWLSSDQKPWVSELDIQSLGLATPRQIPESISRMGPIKFLFLGGNNFDGTIPEFLGWNYSLLDLELGRNKLTGDFPKSFENFAQMPDFWALDLEDNELNGTLPEACLLGIMDKVPGNNVVLNNNYFSGKIPESIRNHPNFSNFWPYILRQKNNGLDFSDLTIPAPTFSFKDIKGNTIDLAETYKQNKYTLLYKWGLWCPFSEEYNQILVPAYKGYKDKGFEVIGFHNDRSLSDGGDGLADFLKTHDIPWVNAIRSCWGYKDDGNSNSNSTILATTTTPELFLVDQNGNIVFNSLMDEKGNNQQGTYYRNQLFKYLEDHLGSIDYNFYTSTDYIQDGKVIILQTASQGLGVDLVFVGEGFTDKDMTETFYQRMYEALDQFFAYEPYTSLRDRFNVYAVMAVSPNAEFFGNAVHAIDEDVSKALEYASKVSYLIPDRPMYVTVVYNNSSGGRSYCTMMEDNSFVCFAMDGVSDVLNHEAGGHGIGKLFDEYVEQGNESLTLPEGDMTYLENVWNNLGWGANVDWRSDPTEVKWAKFINDVRYADEQIGVLEGSYLYGYGAYRPTENSMMRFNNKPFNTPSREEIYKRVMQMSEGEGWTYDYETFVAFDAAGHQQFVNNLTSYNRARGEDSPKLKQVQRTAPPIFLNGTWRDALKKNQR